jgi:hypothetical protein
MKALRYENLAREIASARARRLIEIGTCKGDRAELMIRAALEFAKPKEIAYYGFDLFAAPPEAEFSARSQPWDIEKVRNRLAPLGANIILTEGDSTKTVPLRNVDEVDLAFIDGGHSDETVNADFWNVLPLMRRGAPILLDDYWNYPGGGGCNRLVDSLDRGRFEVMMLEPVDEFRKPYGTLRTQMVKVVLR